MIQNIIIFLIFLAAVTYVARLLLRTFFSNSSGCAKGCGSCSTIDLKKIEADMKRHQQFISAK
jgi:hypothetical protein